MVALPVGDSVVSQPGMVVAFPAGDGRMDLSMADVEGLPVATRTIEGNEEVGSSLGKVSFQ